MDIEQPVKEWESMITPALESKAYEFMLAGYSRVSVQDIWICLEERFGKGIQENDCMKLCRTFCILMEVYI